MEVVESSQEVVRAVGIGLGSAIAVVCSWERNKSIFWAVIHGWLSWFYIIYFAITRSPEERSPD